MSNDIIELWKERDEARADVERLKDKIKIWQMIEVGLRKEVNEYKAQLGIAKEALEFYANLPMSEQDQLWTQELADECIGVARQALTQLEQTKEE